MIREVKKGPREEEMTEKVMKNKVMTKGYKTEKERRM
jgi:hypothetical protein